MRKIILISLFGLLQWSLGQGVWTKTLTYDQGDVNIMDIIKTNDGNFLICGGIITGVRIYDLLLIKMNESGEILWEEVFTDAGLAKQVKETSDGGYIVAGNIYETGQSYNQKLIKLDGSRVEEWEHVIDSANGSDRLSGVIQLADNSYLSVGTHSQLLSMLKVDENGTILWDNQYEKADGWDMVPAWDGGGVIVGTKVEENWLWKINAQGDLDFQNILPGAGNSANISATETTWGVSLTADTSYIMTSLRFPDSSNQYNKHDVGLTKVNIEGRIVWHNSFGKSWASHDEGRAVVQTTDGGYIIAGRTQPDNLANSRVWLIKTDSEGNMEWDNTNLDARMGLGVVESSDGGFIIVGVGGKIFKTDSEGRFEGDIGVVRSAFANQGYSVNQKGRLMTVTYPALKGKTGNTLSMLDLKGKLLGKAGFTQGRATWPVPEGLSGVIVLKFNLGQESFTDRVHLFS